MSDELEQERFYRPSHAPPHLFRAGATYFITARTYEGAPLMLREQRRRAVIEALRLSVEQHGWALVAWVVLPNHYHCILQAPAGAAAALSGVLKNVHRFTSRQWNREDGTLGRTVWYRFWDTCLTSDGGFYARLNYIHYNPVKHGLAAEPEGYEHSSYHEWSKSTDLDLLAESYPWERLDLD